MTVSLGPGVFVTGTDTGVGKTLVAAGLARMLRKRGHKVAVFKPFLSGDPEGMDAQILARAAGLAGPGVLQPALLDVVSPYRFVEAVAPGLAARREGREISLADAVAHAQSLRAVHDVMVVEGAGGLMVPLTANLRAPECVIHLIAALGMPALLVARTALGTLNHTALSVMALRAAGVVVAGIICNQVDVSHPVLDEDHLLALEGLTGIKPVCALPYVTGSEAIGVGTAARVFESLGVWEKLQGVV